MRASLVWTSFLTGLLSFAVPARGADAPNRERDALTLAAKIDQLIARRWEAAKAEPAPRADDAEYLRRVYLDLAGRIPSVSETRTFLDDKRPDKRAQLVER